MRTAIERRLSQIWECAVEKPNNVMMSLSIKRVMCFLTVWAIFYSYQLKSYTSMALFSLAVFVWFFDALITNKGVFLYIDVICLTIVTGVVDSVFMSGELGFASCFICITIGVIAIFLLGLMWGNLLAFINFGFITVLFSIDSLDWIHEAYSQKFCERFPYMMICFLSVAMFIVYGMNKYDIAQRNYKNNLNELIARGKEDRTDISLKILLTMHKTMAAKSPAIAQHSECTAEWTNKLAVEMGIQTASKRRYYYAGLLHDIGKIGLPDEFWDKYELTDEEYEVYRQHVDIGYDIVKKLRLEEISDAALYHHEKWKGNGYKGIRGNEIPEVARVVGVANFISRLIYKEESYQHIIEELMAEAGKAYDVRIVEAACKLLNEEIKKAEEDKIFG